MDFESIHPFSDGNGRTGRLIANLILLQKKYPPIIIRKEQRHQYWNALERSYLKNDDTTIRKFMKKRMIEALEDFLNQTKG